MIKTQVTQQKMTSCILCSCTATADAAARCAGLHVAADVQFACCKDLKTFGQQLQSKATVFHQQLAPILCAVYIQFHQTIQLAQALEAVGVDSDVTVLISVWEMAHVALSCWYICKKLKLLQASARSPSSSCEWQQQIIW